MLSAATISVLLALAPTAAPVPSKTLWVVQPLYPGQELLVTRTEEALRKLMAASQDQLVGSVALADHLAGRKADLRCLTGELPCTDPVDAFVTSLGLERVVLLKGGQEDAAYRYKVTSYVPATGETSFAEGSSSALDRALLAALVKVVPLASTIEISSTPPGATVFIDGEKVGLTPYSGQILPGERVVKVDMTSHMPTEKKIEVPVRGRLQLNESLEKVPARIVITATPMGTAIAIDGIKVGVDKVDRAIQPGRHKVEFTLEGHETKTESVDIPAGANFTLDKSLSPNGWAAFKAVVFNGYDRRGSSITLSYEFAEWRGNQLFAKESPTKDITNNGYLFGRQALERGSLHGVSLAYTQDGKWFGLMVFGGSYLTGADWHYTLEHTQSVGKHQFEGDQWGTPHLFEIRAVQPHLRIPLWRFALYLQAGFEARGLLLIPAEHNGVAPLHDTSLWVVDPVVTAEVALRGFIVEGLFLEAGYRYGWDFFLDPAGLRGFHGGLGYVF